VVESILEIVHHKLPNAAEKVWEVAIPLEGGGSQTANLTRADLEMIPALDQIGPMLGPTLVEACEFVNRPYNWEAIKALSLELEKLAPKCFGSYRVFLIIEEAVADLKDQLDPE